MLKTKKQKVLLMATAICALIGVSYDGYAYAQDGSLAIDRELANTLAVGGVLSGTFLSVAIGISERAQNEPVKLGKIVTAFIIAIGGSLVLLNFQTVTQTIAQYGFVAGFVVYFIMGLVQDQGLTKLDK